MADIVEKMIHERFQELHKELAKIERALTKLAKSHGQNPSRKGR
jgi:hypothetical protein